MCRLQLNRARPHLCLISPRYRGVPLFFIRSRQSPASWWFKNPWRFKNYFLQSGHISLAVTPFHWFWCLQMLWWERYLKCAPEEHPLLVQVILPWFFWVGGENLFIQPNLNLKKSKRRDSFPFISTLPPPQKNKRMLDLPKHNYRSNAITFSF